MNNAIRFQPTVLVAALVLALAGGSAVQALPAQDAGAKATSHELARQDESITAVITRVDKQNRLVTLRGPKGKEATIEAGPDVKNFDQLKVGDQVTATYQAALAFELMPADSVAAGVESTERVDSAAKGDAPGVLGERSTTVTAKLTGLDLKKHTVTLTGPDGNSRTIEVKDPARQAKMSSLKVGQMVRITYAEAVAVQVVPKQ